MQLRRRFRENDDGHRVDPALVAELARLRREAAAELAGLQEALRARADAIAEREAELDGEWQHLRRRAARLSKQRQALREESGRRLSLRLGRRRQEGDGSEADRLAALERDLAEREAALREREQALALREAEVPAPEAPPGTLEEELRGRAGPARRRRRKPAANQDPAAETPAETPA